MTPHKPITEPQTPPTRGLCSHRFCPTPLSYVLLKQILRVSLKDKGSC